MWVLARRFPKYWGRTTTSSDDVARAHKRPRVEVAPGPRIFVTTADDEDATAPAAHPCPEELGSDNASAERRRR